MAGADDPGAEHDAAPRSGRRRAGGAQGGLSVADLLARHGLDQPANPQRGPGTRHLLRTQPDDWKRWTESDDEPAGRSDPKPGSADDWGDLEQPPRGVADDRQSTANEWFQPNRVTADRPVDQRGGTDLEVTDRMYSGDVLGSSAPRHRGTVPSGQRGGDLDDAPTDVVLRAPRSPEVPPLVLPPWPSASRGHDEPVLDEPEPADVDGASAYRDIAAASSDPDDPSAAGGASVAPEARSSAPPAKAAPATEDPGGLDSAGPDKRVDRAGRFGARDSAEPNSSDDEHEGDLRDDATERRLNDRDDPADRDDAELGFQLRAQRIDESLTRLTAIHAGLGLEMTERVSSGASGRSTDASGRSSDGADVEHAADLDEFPATRRPGWSRAGRLAGLVAAVTLFMATGAGWGVQTWLNGKLRTVAALDPNATTVINLAAQTGDQNYLLAGIDTVGTGGDAAGRSDTSRADAATPTGGADAATPTQSPQPGRGLTSVLLVHVPAKVDRVVLTAFPANLAVDRPSCDRWDGTDYPGGTTPAQPAVALAETYAVGGPRCLTKAIQQLTGLSVNHYTGLDLAGVAPMVDAVHGVPICLTGTATRPSVLTGAQALDFVRGGSADTASADHPVPALDADDPGAHGPQVFLAAMLRKATSDQVLAHFDELSGLVAAFGEHARGDRAGLVELSTLAHALHATDPSKVFLVSAPTAGAADARGSQPLATDSAKALFDAIRADAPLPGEQAARPSGGSGAPGGAAANDGANTVPRGSVPPTAVRLTVRNGSSRSGLANQAADSLRTLGFSVASVGDAPPSAGGRTVVRHSADRSDQAQAVADAVPAAVSETVPGTTGLLELVLGDGFDGQVRAAPVAADQASGPRTLKALAGSCG